MNLIEQKWCTVCTLECYYINNNAYKNLNMIIVDIVSNITKTWIVTLKIVAILPSVTSTKILIYLKLFSTSLLTTCLNIIKIINKKILFSLRDWLTCYLQARLGTYHGADTSYYSKYSVRHNYTWKTQNDVLWGFYLKKKRISKKVVLRDND